MSGSQTQRAYKCDRPRLHKVIFGIRDLHQVDVAGPEKQRQSRAFASRWPARFLDAGFSPRRRERMIRAAQLGEAGHPRSMAHTGFRVTRGRVWIAVVLLATLILTWQPTLARASEGLFADDPQL